MSKSIRLSSSDVVIKEKFNQMVSFKDVAGLLEVPQELLWKVLMHPNGKEYRDILIQKKNSKKKRRVQKPGTNLLIIQKKLAYILNLVYTKHHQSSHGFIENRSILTNAQPHINKGIILNIDLENFFNSIEFARIRGMFKSYFKLNDVVATTLANICCNNENKLPQGSPTSPIISNIICNKLDREFTKISYRKKGIYTRYADDITFSFNSLHLPREFATVNSDEIVLGGLIEGIITSNGFKVNYSKLRVSSKYQSQYVTGIKTNEKLNVDRQYIRRIRSILNCIEKNIDKLEEAILVFKEKHNPRNTFDNNIDMFNILKGMIGHVGNVKTKEDQVFRKLAIRYNQVVTSVKKYPEYSNLSYILIPLTKEEFNQRNTFVVDSGEAEYTVNDISYKATSSQGTGFLLKGFGLVTNVHVIKQFVEVLEYSGSFNDEYYLTVHRSFYSKNKYLAKIIYYSIERDIAVLEIQNYSSECFGFEYNNLITTNEKIKILGYPEYKGNQELRGVDGEVLGKRYHIFNNVSYPRYEIKGTIPPGNSGGPILNELSKVIAIAVKGKDGYTTEVIPISELTDNFSVIVDSQERVGV